MTYLKRYLISTMWLGLFLSGCFWLPAPSFAQWYPEQNSIVLHVAKQNLYVREKNNDNRSPEIDLWLKSIGLGVGNPYCAAFTLWCYSEAARMSLTKMPLPKIGRVSILYSTCKKNPYRYKVIPATRVFRKIDATDPADLICWSHGKVANNPNWNGHVGLVTEQLTNNKIRTVEGNTGPGDEGDQREGSGVFNRIRDLGIGKKFQVEGFIRVK